MGIISVDSASLAWLATDCDRLASTIVTTAPAVNGGLGATSAAVRALHNGVDETAQRIASRLRSTAEGVSNAGRKFAASEAINEDSLYEV